METLKFAHISDTHLPGCDSSDFVKSLSPNPWDILKNCLKEIATEKPDFVLHTGDIIHEGRADDYKKLRRLFNEALPNIPIFCALGNHDIRPNFSEGFLGVSESSPEYLSANVCKGLKILAIDTALEKQMMGKIYEHQLDFIEENIREKSEYGTIIIMHQPPVSEIPQLQMVIPNRLCKLASNDEIIGFFAGHMHSNFACNFCKKPVITANSLAFGIEYFENTAKYTNYLAYNICKLNENGFAIHTKIVSPQTLILQEKRLG